MNHQIIKQLIQEQQPIRLPEHHIIRSLWGKFEPLQDNNQIIIIKGMRRSGKSTFIQYARSQQLNAHFYFNFDDDRLVDFTIHDFQLLLEMLIELIGPAKIVFFDEIQNIPGWEKFVRRLHDQQYKIYLTGSNAQLFSHELGTHLTGRYIGLEMYPYSFKEYLSISDSSFDIARTYTTEDKAYLKSVFNRYFQTGGIPDYVRFEQPDYLNDLYDSILYRDIIVRHKIGKEQALKSLVYYLASHVGKDVSFNKLKTLLKLASANTVSDYCYYLEMSYLCFFISRYSPSLKVQAHYGKKEYVIDHALAQKIGFRISEDRGRLLENIVFLELKRRGHDIYFHRENKECDFIIKQNNVIVQAIQVTTELDSPETEKREFAGLQEAMSSYHLQTGLILTENTEAECGNISIMPIWKWLLSYPHI
ncbi:MAG: ATP-binding protein [Legionellaceae bacterium]|nr:ATP-binding protein [Legionellaceae bacterium]